MIQHLEDITAQKITVVLTVFLRVFSRRVYRFRDDFNTDHPLRCRCQNLCHGPDSAVEIIDEPAFCLSQILPDDPVERLRSRRIGLEERKRTYFKGESQQFFSKELLPVQNLCSFIGDHVAELEEAAAAVGGASDGKALSVRIAGAREVHKSRRHLTVELLPVALMAHRDQSSVVEEIRDI